MTLDPAGRLLGFYVAHGPGPTSDATVEWRAWIARTGLDPEQFEPDSAAVVRPPVFCTQVFAWKEKNPAVGTGGRAERGRATFFRVTGPWHGRREVWGSDELPAETAGRYVTYINHVILAVMLMLAGRNLLQGRADVRIAVSIAASILVVALVARALAGWHALEPVAFATPVVGRAVWVGLVAGLGYLGIEPTVRRLWPWRLTGRVRLFGGRVRNPLVGRDILVGIACGILMVLSYIGLGAVAAELGASSGFEPSFTPYGITEETSYGACSPLSARLLGTIGWFFNTAVLGLCTALALFLVFRREAAALGAISFST